MNDLFSVKNKNIMITGASSGIGQFFATTLAEQGANVILLGRNADRLHETEKVCKKSGVQVLSIVGDVKDSQQIIQIIESTKKQFPHLDVLINAAGIGLRLPILEITEQQWDDVMDTNLKGTFLIAQEVAKWMISTKTRGNIINISSSAAFHTSKTRATYSASKIAVESLTRTFALNLIEHGIRVNCIAPGFFVTALTEKYIVTDIGKSEIDKVPMQRAANVKELMGPLLLLVSEASSYMTGSVLHVDGGYAISKV